jgi:hypothetical protein
MVLQMEPKSSHIWGFGEAGAEVTLTEKSVEINKTIVQGKFQQTVITKQNFINCF